jgi:hypothetical protein
MEKRHVDFEVPSGNATAVFESAVQFGLTPDEILKVVGATLDHLPRPVTVECIDELAGALAARVLEKEREV